MFGFEKLEVWQIAIQFSNQIYSTTRNFPVDERFGLTNQLRRAGVSIAANIAEGSSRGSRKDFSRFIEIAYGSLMEIVSHIRIARDQSFLNGEDYERLYSSAQQLARMLSGLQASLQ